MGDRWTDRPDTQQSPGSEVKDSVAAPPLLPTPFHFLPQLPEASFPFPVQAPSTFSPSLISPSSTFTLLDLLFPSPPSFLLLFHTTCPSSSSLLLPLPPVPSPLPLFWPHLGFARTIWGSMWFLESRSGIPKSKFGLAAPLCVRALQTAPLLCPRCCALGGCGTGSHTDFRGPRERGRGEQAANEAGKLPPQPNLVFL